MRLVLVRHGPAADRFEFARSGHPDGLRPLTERGREKTRRAAAGLCTLLQGQLDAIATSPLLRARQTAELLGGAFGGLEPVETPALEPGVPTGELADYMRRFGLADCVAAVGHEPDLSEAVGFFLCGVGRPVFEFKKAAACLIDFHAEPGPGSGTLVWALQPAGLRALAD